MSDDADKTIATIRVELTQAELELLRQALDSHAYWQLSDPYYRHSGYVRPPGSDDPEETEAIQATDALDRKLGAALREWE
jgi:hypothetical protein